MHDDYIIEIEEGAVVASTVPEVLQIVEDDEQSVDLLEIAVEGPQGPAGPEGPAGPGASTWSHHQTSPAAQWNITHNVGQPRTPVIILDSSPTEQVYTRVDHVDENTALITFPSPETGWAYF